MLGTLRTYLFTLDVLTLDVPLYLLACLLAHLLNCALTGTQALLGPDAPSMDAVQRTLLHHFSEVFGVELEPEVAPEIAPEIGSLGLPADATGLSAGATGPSPAPLVS